MIFCLGRGENHLLEIFGNPYEKSEISYALTRNPFEKWEISYTKCGSDLPLGLGLTFSYFCREMYGN